MFCYDNDIHACHTICAFAVLYINWLLSCVLGLFPAQYYFESQLPLLCYIGVVGRILNHGSKTSKGLSTLAKVMRIHRCKRGAKKHSSHLHLNWFGECELEPVANESTSRGGLNRIEPV